jgi:hypothetical protein
LLDPYDFRLVCVEEGRFLPAQSNQGGEVTTYLAKQGVVYSDPSTGEVLSILEELETPGTEYLNIQLHDDEGWKLDVYENGFVEFYNGDESKRMIRKNVSHEEVIQMWRLMQDGERERIKKMMRSRAKAPVID